VNINHSIIVRNFLALFGHRAENKHIPDFLWKNLSQIQKMKIVDAYLCGDGHIGQYCKTTATVSKTLGFQVRDILFTEGLSPSIIITKPIYRDNINRQIVYTINWTDTRKKIKTGVRKIHNHYAFIVKDINKKYVENEIIYDIQVANTHKYLANGFISSNCYFDIKTKKSSNKYKAGGPESFSNTICPVCFGAGRSQERVTETINLRCYFTPDAWKSLNVSVADPDGIAVCIGYMSDLYKIEKSTKIILCNTIEQRKYEYVRNGEAVPWGFRRNRYFSQKFKRVSGG
jgi:hypothetical protein